LPVPVVLCPRTRIDHRHLPPAAGPSIGRALRGVGPSCGLPATACPKGPVSAPIKAALSSLFDMYGQIPVDQSGRLGRMFWSIGMRVASMCAKDQQ